MATADQLSGDTSSFNTVFGKFIIYAGLIPKGVFMVTLEACVPGPGGECSRVEYSMRGNTVYVETDSPYVLFKHDSSLRLLCEGSSMQVLQWAGERYTLWRMRPRGRCVTVPGGVMEDHGEYYVFTVGEQPSSWRLGNAGRLLALALRLAGYTPIVVFDDDIASQLVNAVHGSNESLNEAKARRLLGEEAALKLRECINILGERIIHERCLQHDY